LKQFEEILQSLAQKVSQKGFRVSTRIVEGDPGEELCNQVEKEKLDAIFLGNRGLGRVKKLLVGSVSDYVIGHAKATVIISKLDSKL
jgi:nucleotide-binding universal stress UspA family protein